MTYTDMIAISFQLKELHPLASIFGHYLQEKQVLWLPACSSQDISRHTSFSQVNVELHASYIFIMTTCLFKYTKFFSTQK